MHGNFCLNHYKQSAKEGFLPLKYYNLPLGVRPEPIALYSLSAKDFFLEKGFKSLNKTQKKTPSQRIFNKPISPEETYIDDLVSRQNTLPIMKPFSMKPLRTIKKKRVISQKKSPEKEKKLLYVEGFSNIKEKKTTEIPLNLTENQEKKRNYNRTRPLTSKSQQKKCDFQVNFNLSSFKRQKKAGFPYEMKGLVKVGEVYDLLRLGAYERIKRIEEIEKILDIPSQDVMIQRPMSSDQLIRFSQQTSVRAGIESFLNKRAMFI